MTQDGQVRKLLSLLSRGMSLQDAAMKSRMDEKTARKFRSRGSTTHFVDRHLESGASKTPSRPNFHQQLGHSTKSSSGVSVVVNTIGVCIGHAQLAPMSPVFLFSFAVKIRILVERYGIKVADAAICRESRWRALLSLRDPDACWATGPPAPIHACDLPDWPHCA